MGVKQPFRFDACNIEEQDLVLVERSGPIIWRFLRSIISSWRHGLQEPFVDHSSEDKHHEHNMRLFYLRLT